MSPFVVSFQICQLDIFRIASDSKAFMPGGRGHWVADKWQPIANCPAGAGYRFRGS